MPRLWSAAALTVLSALTALPGSDALAQDPTTTMTTGSSWGDVRGSE
jgi:hypothetical protein